MGTEKRMCRNEMQERLDKIFQGYDVRGIYPDEYDTDVAYRLGRAAVEFCGAERVIIGRDMRRGGPELFSALANGAIDQGADVTDAGMCSSDALYHAGADGGYDLSLMVTASHNPAEFNGTKIVQSDGTSVGKNSGLLEIKKMVLEGAFPEAGGRGTFRNDEGVMERFIDYALGFIDPDNLTPLKIVVDAGNGMGGVLTELLRAHVPFEIIPMNFEPDGTFPAHDPDPTRPECVEILRQRVREENADLGLGFDGDADRAALIDEKGGLINGSELGSVLARKILARQPGAKISYCLVSSWTIRDTIEDHGGQPVITPVGGANIRQVMKEEDIVLATERSGHYYLKENHLADSGLIAALMALEDLCQEGCTLSELIDPYRKYRMAPELSILLGTPESSVSELDEIKREKMQRANEFAQGAEVIVRNEPRFEFKDWWFCVRPSGTEPRRLRMTVEAKTQEQLDERYEQVKALLAE